MDWTKPCAYDQAQKRAFHATGKRQLKELAKALGFAPGTFDIRSNMAGIAVSGEITLHADHLYVQISQPCTGADTGVLIRTCEGREDYTGGRNHFAPLSALDRIDTLAAICRAVLQEGGRS
jgi:hypothetical protein